MKSKKSNKNRVNPQDHGLVAHDLQLYCGLLTRIRQEAIRPAEHSCETKFSITECNRDCEEIHNRVKSEGLPFLTVSLPKLGKAFDRALLGHLGAFADVPFKKDDTGLPKFLGEHMRAVFTADGTVREDPNPQSVRLIRQLTLSFYKLKVPYAPKLEEEVLDRFCQTDETLPICILEKDGRLEQDMVGRISTLPEGDVVYLDHELSSVSTIARYIIATILGGSNPRDIRPRHGPGSVATGEVGPEKAYFTEWSERLESFYPYYEYAMYSLGQVCDTYRNPPSYVRAGTAKVVLVPKDSRGPRLISEEPLYNQWIQQGQRRVIEDAITAHPLSKGQVNFTDQTVNGKLAMASSVDKRFATLDMKDASDRVSWALIELLFPRHWVEALFATRSSSTRLPNGKLVRLKKYAPMGSATCFPVESLVFFALTTASVYCKHMRKRDGTGSLCGRNVQLDKQLLRQVASSIYVYGDDLIIRTEDCGSVLSRLPFFGLTFNDSKCCMAGLFRESCGVDAFNGTNVTPIRFSEPYRSISLTPDALLSWVDVSNRLYWQGYQLAANWVSDELLKKQRIPTLFTPDSSRFSPQGGIFFYRPFPGSPGCNPRRWSMNSPQGRPSLQARALTVVSLREEVDRLGWEEMLRVESLNMDDCPTRPSFDVDNIYRRKMAGVYALRGRYKLKPRWVPIDPNQ